MPGPELQCFSRALALWHAYEAFAKLGEPCCASHTGSPRQRSFVNRLFRASFQCKLISMAVEVTLKARDFKTTKHIVEPFNGEDDAYVERKDGKLEVHRADGTVKVYTADMWLTVDGKRKEPDTGFA